MADATREPLPTTAAQDPLPPLREETALLKLLQAFVGWCKISCPTTPSTSPVGNTHVLQAASTLASELNLKIAGRRFCGLRDSGFDVDMAVRN